MAEETKTGDAVKLRKALEAAHRTLKLVNENAAEFIQPHLADEIIHTGSAIEAALAAPRRNCDVGTAEEQEARFHATGELYHTLTLRNALTWAQMPYEEGGAK